MTPIPPTPSSPTDVPATPQSAIPQDALGQAEALPSTPVAPEKETAHLLMAAVWATKKFGTADLYFSQVYGGSEDYLYYITSPETLVTILGDFARIDHLVLLSHAFDDHIALGTASKTPEQLRQLLAPVMPAVQTLTIDGCTAGKEPVELYNLAVGLGVAELRAWTYFHHLEVWGRPEATPDPNENLDAVLDFAAPYIPQGSSGAHLPASQLKAQMDTHHTFAVITEFFTYNLEDQLTFETLTDRVTHPGPTGPPLPDPWTRVRAPSEAEYPRAQAQRLDVTSSLGAEAALSKVKAIEATPYLVVIRP